MRNMLAHLVTHEMITPLNCILTFCRRLVDENDPQRRREILALCKQSTLLLRYVLRDLLDKNQIESGQFELVSDWLLLTPLITSVVAMM